MVHYSWTINGAPSTRTSPCRSVGADLLLTLTNNTVAWHPMHLHGHTFQIIRPDGSRGVPKDTVIVAPMRKLAVALVADRGARRSAMDVYVRCHRAGTVNFRYAQSAGVLQNEDGLAGPRDGPNVICCAVFQ